MSDTKQGEPDEDLLEFLGGIDELNGESKDGDFSDFLANADIERIAADKKPKPPPQEPQHE
jgi:hypothetical protein